MPIKVMKKRPEKTTRATATSDVQLVPGSDVFLVQGLLLLLLYLDRYDPPYEELDPLLLLPLSLLLLLPLLPPPRPPPLGAMMIVGERDRHQTSQLSSWRTD